MRGSQYVENALPTPDGQHIISGGTFGDLKVFRISDGILLRTVRPCGFNVVPTFDRMGMSVDGTRLALACINDGGANLLRILSVPDLGVVRTITMGAGEFNSPYYDRFQFTPDGLQIMASGGLPGKIGFYRVSDGAFLRNLTYQLPFPFGISDLQGSSAALSPGGSTIALSTGAPYNDGSFTTVLVPFAGGQEITQVFERFVSGVPAFSPDGTLLSVSSGVLIRIYQTASAGLPFCSPSVQQCPPPVIAFSERGDIATPVSFSPDGTKIAYSLRISGATELRIRSVGGAWPLIASVPIQAPNRFVPYRFLPGSGQLLTHAAARLQLWDANNGAFLRDILAHQGGITAVAYAPDGQTVATASELNREAAIRIWDAATGALVRTIPLPQTVERTVESLQFSPDGQLLLAGSLQANSYLLRISDGAVVSTLPALSPPVTFSPNGVLILGGGVLFRTNGATQFASASPGGTTSYFTPDGLNMWVKSSSFPFQLVRYSIPANPTGLLNPAFSFTPSPNFGAFALSPDGQTLAVLSETGPNFVSLYRASDGVFLRGLTGNTARLFTLAFTPDGQFLAAGGSDPTLNFWRVSDGTLVQTYTQETGMRNGSSEFTRNIRSITFSPDGRRVFYGRFDGAAVMANNPVYTPPVLSVAVPSSLVRGNSGLGTVTLASAAGPLGTTVLLSTTSPGITIPASIQIPAGSTAGTFNIGTNNNAVAGPVTIQAFTNGPAQSGTFQLVVMVRIEVDTEPSGLSVQVNGSSVTTPYAIDATPGSSLSLGAFDIASGPGARQQFQFWSNGGPAVQTIPVPSTATTYRAVFQQQYFLTANAVGSGVIAATSGWQPQNEQLLINAVPIGGAQFLGFSGDLTGLTNPQTLTMNGPKTVTASFTVPQLVLTGSIVGRTDGTLPNERVWTVRLSNAGTTATPTVRLTNAEVLQVTGTAPVALSPQIVLPVVFGSIPAGGSLTGNIGLIFPATVPASRISLRLTWTADGGATGQIVLNNLFR